MGHLTTFSAAEDIQQRMKWVVSYE